MQKNLITLYCLQVSSYLSNSSRQWLEKMQEGRQYRIHIIEGKLVKHLIVNTFPDLIDKYFVDKYEKLLLESMRNWLIHDILPNPPVISMFEKELNFRKLETSEISFLWCTGKYNTDEINDWCLQEENEPFSLDFLFDYLCYESNCEEPLIRLESNIKVINCSYGSGYRDLVFSKCLSAKILFEESHSLYTFACDGEGKGIEVLISANGDFTTKIRYVGKNATIEMKNAMNLLYNEIAYINES